MKISATTGGQTIEIETERGSPLGFDNLTVPVADLMQQRAAESARPPDLLLPKRKIIYRDR